MGKKADQAKETPQQRAMAELAANQMVDYRKRWLPVQKKLAENIQRAGEADSFERDAAAGRASTETAVRFGEARGGIESALTDAGAGPNSSKFKLATMGLGDDEATSRGLGFVASDQAIDDAYLQGLGALTTIGRGERAGAINGMQQVADMSGRQAQADAQISAQHRMGNAQMAGQVIGFGLAGAMQNPVAAPKAPDSGFGSVPGGFVAPDGFPKGGMQFNNPSAYTGGM